MPRQRLGPGEHGHISVTARAGRHYAECRVRDTDGKIRRVERSSSKSAEDARRLLQRHLRERRAPVAGGQSVNDKTTFAELFELWITAKAAEDGIAPQSVKSYRQVWRTHGADQLGALPITELSSSSASAYLLNIGASAQAKRLRMILSGMFGMSVRFGVLAVNPIRETKTTKTARRPARAATPAEFTSIRAAVIEYVTRNRPGPRDGVSRLLPAFVECLAATGARANEVLAIQWPDVDLLADPPTVTITGTLIDHGRVAGKPLHRQDKRKRGAPAHTVVLPRFGVDALTALVADSGGLEGPVFVNRGGGWVSLSNMRRALRAALPTQLSWVTPHSFRRTVATSFVMSMGRLRLSSSCRTRSWRPQRRTTCSGRRAGPTFATPSTATPADECGGKVETGRVSRLCRGAGSGVHAEYGRARRDSNPQPSDP